MFSGTLKTEKIQPRSIYNQLAAQQTQEQNIVVAQKEHGTKTLDKKIEQDTSNTADSTISEDKNRQVSEVKQQKIRKETKHIYNIRRPHSGAIWSYTVPEDDTKLITIYKDGSKIEENKITGESKELTKVTNKELEQEFAKIKEKYPMLFNN